MLSEYQREGEGEISFTRPTSMERLKFSEPVAHKFTDKTKFLPLAMTDNAETRSQPTSVIL